jgi:hypothetical protein
MLELVVQIRVLNQFDLKDGVIHIICTFILQGLNILLYFPGRNVKPL